MTSNELLSPEEADQQTTQHAQVIAEAATRPAQAFTPPPVSSLEPAPSGGFTPPPVSSLESSPTEALKHQGFLESAWNTIKSPLSALMDMVTPHSLADRRKFAIETANRVAEVTMHGTPEQKKALHDEMLTALPFGSTIYKAKEGNYAGAAGDVAGMAALGGAAKAGTSPTVSATARGFASGTAESLRNAPPSTAGKVLGRGAGYLAGKKLGGYESGVIGAYTGGEVGAKVPAIPDAIRAGVARARVRFEQQTNPPRPQPPWQTTPGEPATPAPITAQQPPGPLPSGRRAGPAPPREQSSRPSPAWKTASRDTRTPAPPPRGPSPPVSRTLPSGRTIPTAEDITAKVNKAVEAVQNSAPPVDDMQMLDGLAQSQAGKPFAKATPSEQAAIRDLAARIKAQQAPASPGAAPRPPQPTVRQQPVEQPPAAPAKSLAQLIREEVAAAKAGRPVAAPEAASAPTAPPEPAAATGTAPGPRTLPQTEAAMAQKSPAAVESPQSQYTAAGDRKSPQLRAEEIKSMNRIAKAGRFVDALQTGRLKVSDVMRMDDSHWQMLADGIKEKIPSAETRAEIISTLRKLQGVKSSAAADAPKTAEPSRMSPRSLSLAQKLDDEMRRSGTIQ